MYFRAKQLDTALSNFETAVKLDPQLADAVVNRGLVYQQLGFTAKAKEDLNRAAELFRQQGKTESYNQIKQMLQQF